MQITTHISNDLKIAEINSEERLINTSEEGFQILVDLYYQDFDKIVIYEKNLTPDFFELKNGMAGEMLQKFSNYRVRLAIVGDFLNYTTSSILQFMSESNKLKQIIFVKSLDDALKIFATI